MEIRFVELMKLRDIQIGWFASHMFSNRIDGTRLRSIVVQLMKLRDIQIGWLASHMFSNRIDGTRLRSIVVQTWGKCIPSFARDNIEDFLQQEPYSSVFRGFVTFWISISISITWPCQCEVLGDPSSNGTFCCDALRNYCSNEYVEEFGVKLKFCSFPWRGSLFVKGGPGTANSYPRHCSSYSW